MPLSTEVTVSVIFGILGATIAIAAIVQAALYFSHLHRGKLLYGLFESRRAEELI